MEIAELRAFRQQFYPDIEVEIILDPGLKNKGFRGLASEGKIALSEIITSGDIAYWEKLLPGIKINAIGALYLNFLHELGHVFLGHVKAKSGTAQQTDKHKTLLGVDDAVKRLPEDLQETARRILEERELMCDAFAIVEFMRLLKLGVFV